MVICVPSDSATTTEKNLTAPLASLNQLQLNQKEIEDAVTRDKRSLTRRLGGGTGGPEKRQLIGQIGGGGKVEELDGTDVMEDRGSLRSGLL